MPEEGKPLEIGKGRIVREGHKVALLSYGARLGECLKAADELAALGLSTTVADARFAKPLDADLLLRLAREHEVLVTIEEGSIGGFGSYVLQALAEHGVLDRGLKRALHGAAGRLHRPGHAGGDVRQGRPRRQGHRRQGVRGARQGRRRGDGEARVGLQLRLRLRHFLALLARFRQADSDRLLAARDLLAAAAALERAFLAFRHRALDIL